MPAPGSHASGPANNHVLASPQEGRRWVLLQGGNAVRRKAEASWAGRFTVSGSRKANSSAGGAARSQSTTSGRQTAAHSARRCALCNRLKCLQRDSEVTRLPFSREEGVTGQDRVGLYHLLWSHDPRFLHLGTAGWHEPGPARSALMTPESRGVPLRSPLPSSDAPPATAAGKRF